MSQNINVNQGTDDFESMFEGSAPAEPTASVVNTITVRTTTGDSRYVPVQGPTSLRLVLQQAGLPINGVTQFWMDGVQLSSQDQIIPVGAQVMLVTSVKGGEA
jgi:hypothetical protein